MFVTKKVRGFYVFRLDLNFIGLILILTLNQVAPTKSKCDYPLISFSFFNETLWEPNTPPKLYSVESRVQQIGEEVVIPYQYFLVTCSAPYPIEWVVEDNIPPQHYYFSYILDDERRSFLNGSFKPQNEGGNEAKEIELFIAWQHIGNETLAKANVGRVTASCRPVEQDMLSCGQTWINIRRVGGGESFSRNITELAVSYNFTVPNGEPVQSDENNVDGHTGCFKWPTSSEIKDVNSNAMQCNSSLVEESEFTSESFKLPSEIELLGLNKSELTRPRGLLTCSSKEKQPEPDFPEKEVSPKLYTFPYVYSLPKLCPNEDPTLPHLYLMNKSSEIRSTCLTSENEDEFISLCVGNPADVDNAIYVGDNVTVTCISSLYYFAAGMRISEIRSASQNISVPHENRTYISKEQRELANGQNGYRNMTISVPVTDTSVDKFECKAPVRKSREWKSKTVQVHIKVPIKPTFLDSLKTATFYNHQLSEIFLLCNVSGDPLPTLSWSRFTNGNIPENQTVSTGNESTVPWISSKLSFPSDSSNLSEYYGPYICTAKNRFHSVEDVGFQLNESSSPGFPWLVATVIGAILVLMVVIILLGWKLRHQTKNLRLFTKAEIDEFIFGRPELLLGGGEYEEINSYATYLPYDRTRFEIKRELLEFDPCDILGSGAYGTVYKGVLRNLKGSNLEVAIKTVDASSDKIYFAALLSEIKIMCYIGKHEHVVELIGACTKYLDQRQIFVATEFCSNGDLLSYIQKHRDTFINNVGQLGQREWEDFSTNDEVPSSLEARSKGYCRLSNVGLLHSPHLLLVWALQISQGMTFLSSKKVIHGDLAARNILLAFDLKPKIGDFGLSKRIQSYSSYVRKDDDVVPWRWLAIESLQFMKYSIKSDIWAFAVVLYELFSLGQVPYANYSFSELFIVSLCQGERLKKPNFADEKLYNLMLDCWKHCPDERPSFQIIEGRLKTWATESKANLMSPKRANQFIDILSQANVMEKIDGFEQRTVQIPNTNAGEYTNVGHFNTGYVVSVPPPGCKPQPVASGYVGWNNLE